MSKQKQILQLSLSFLFITNLYSNNDINSTKYQPSIIPKHMSVKEKKKRFISLILPAINQVYFELDTQYNTLKNTKDINLSDKNITQLIKSYSAKDYDDLLERLKPHPKSIALAQAAMESSWATSRFFQEANNIFGVWSNKKDEAKIKANVKRGKQTIYLKKYQTIADAVRDYYKTIATTKVFKQFRVAKMQNEPPLKLVEKLDKYSERGEKYTKELKSIIRYNHFEKFDK